MYIVHVHVHVDIHVHVFLYVHPLQVHIQMWSHPPAQSIYMYVYRNCTFAHTHTDRSLVKEDGVTIQRPLHGDGGLPHRHCDRHGVHGNHQHTGCKVSDMYMYWYNYGWTNRYLSIRSRS